MWSLKKRQILEVRVSKKKGKLVVKEGEDVIELKSKKRKLDVDRKQKKVVADDDDFVDLVFIAKATTKTILEKKKQRRKRHTKDMNIPDDLDKYSNITACEEEIAKIQLQDPRDYNLKILKILNETLGNGYSQAQEELIKELWELKMKLVKTNNNQQALEGKVEAHVGVLKQYIIDSNTKLLSGIKLLFNNKDAKGSLPTDQVSEEPSNRKKYDSCFNVGKSNAFESRDFTNMFSGGTDFHEVKVQVHFRDDDTFSGEQRKTVVIAQVLADIKLEDIVTTDKGIANHSIAGGKADSSDDFGEEAIPTFDIDFELSDNLTQLTLSIIENQKQARKNHKQDTPEERARKKIPRMLITSPYVQDYDSGASVSKPIFQIKHPFSNIIGSEVDNTLRNAFTTWLYQGLSKKRNAPT